ncbi:MAG TPA: hypothetical protein VMR06_15255 [Dokdonella sp.]|uniref:hypothetical protein n=1 Tax=Dokdonella sp. TaxID=2291710 RepID=UPI002BF8E845|nr:hypothetical protein [Dokdonella sp.]HUD43349.1 hypothetical protein [Dokdonella sp.]
MNDNRLAQLYRDLTARSAGPVALDADTLVAAAAGSLPAERREAVVSRLAASPAEADLVRMLAVLEDDSQALATDLARYDRSHGRRLDRRARPIAATARRTRTVRWAGMGACLMAVLGLWSTHRIGPGSIDGASNGIYAEHKSDRIFTTKDSIFAWSNGESGAQGGQDKLFHSEFNGS